MMGKKAIGGSATDPGIEAASKAPAGTSTVSDGGRARSPSIASTDPDKEGGVRLDAVSTSDEESVRSAASETYTPPHARRGMGNPMFARQVRDAGAEQSGFQVGEPSEDVFLSPAKAAAVQPSGNVAASPAKRDVVGRLASANASNSALMLRNANSDIVLRVRGSNLSGRHLIGDEDAQAVYPPTACVFVANLAEPKTDEALEAALTREFSQYGTVFIKIRRDGRNMPFAFCQYTVDEDAQAAVEQGKGAMIFGRPCRTEMVKANRSFVITKRNRGVMNLEEARSAMESYGQIASIKYVDEELKQSLGLASAVVVEFKHFDPSRDLASIFRHHDFYRVQPFDIKRLGAAATPQANPDAAFLERYDADRRSIFVGGLPPHANEEGLKNLMEGIGQVLKLHVVKKPTVNGEGIRVFAFIEFARPDTPDLAIQNFHETDYEGSKLRIERKRVTNPTPTARRVRSQATMSLRSSRDRFASGTLRAVRQQMSPTRQSSFQPPVARPSVAAPPPYPWCAPYAGPQMPAPGFPGGPMNMAAPPTPQGTPGTMPPFYPMYAGYYPAPYFPDPMAAMNMAFSPAHMMHRGRSFGEDVAGSPTRAGNSNTKTENKKNMDKNN